MQTYKFMESDTYWIIAVFFIIALYLIFRWRPKKGIWYRNTIKSFNMGHLNYVRNCFIIIKGKKHRGSFKVVNNKVLYMFGWKYHKKSIRSIEKSKCSFSRFKKHIPLAEQGSSEEYITTYLLKIR